MKNKIAFFLDFDGVLHHYFPVPEKSDTENKHFYYLNNFENTIRELSNEFDLYIVISSTWRKTRDMSTLKGLFSEDIQEFIVDKTPVLSDEDREIEIQSWIETNKFDGEYLILDDCDFLFKDKSKLVHCYDKFDQREIDILKEKVKQMF